jgi:hypothetical protein
VATSASSASEPSSTEPSSSSTAAAATAPENNADSVVGPKEANETTSRVAEEHTDPDTDANALASSKDQSSSPEAGFGLSPDPSATSLHLREITRIQSTALIEEVGDDDDDDDDDDGLMPDEQPSIYEIRNKMQEEEEEKAKMQEDKTRTKKQSQDQDEASEASAGSSTAVSSVNSSVGADSRRSRSRRSQFQPHEASAAAVLEAKAKTRTVPLTEFYPTIQSLFAPAYNRNGTLVGRVDSNGWHRSGYAQNMSVQAKLYAEWMGVMRDYATVFSEDRGITADGGMGSTSIYAGTTRALHYRVKSVRPEVCSIVEDVFQSELKQWEELPSGLGLGLSWNLLWTWQKPRLNLNDLLVWQRVNHFMDSKQLTRKDYLKKNLARYTSMRGKAAEAFQIMPETYVLPHEYTQFVRAFTETESRHFFALQSEKQQQQEKGGEKEKDGGEQALVQSEFSKSTGAHNLWIVKPVGMSRGRGIEIVSDISSFTYAASTVVQKYIPNPMTLDGYKFDLRLYVLVTSFSPLEAFIYTEGFARLSTEKVPFSTHHITVHMFAFSMVYASSLLLRQ